jgi:hypothetical protein
MMGICRAGKLLCTAYLKPTLAGRFLCRHPVFGWVLTLFLTAQVALGAWLVMQNNILRISPMSVFLPLAFPVRTLITVTIGAAFLRLCSRIAGVILSWQTSTAIIAHAGLLYLLGDVVKVVTGSLRNSMTETTLPSLANIVSSAGLAGKWLQEAHIIAAWFVALVAFMLIGADRIRPLVAVIIALAVWGMITAFRLSVIRTAIVFLQ